MLALNQQFSRAHASHEQPVMLMHYYGFRYYDAQTGRWPSRDALGDLRDVEFDYVDTKNLYSFVLNGPLSDLPPKLVTVKMRELMV